MNNRLLKMTCLLGAFVALAGAASSYNVKIYESVQVGATELKAGDYKITMQGDKAVFKSGKNVVEIPATLERSDKKFNNTSLLSENSKVSEIEVGGTTMKIVFTPPVASDSASK